MLQAFNAETGERVMPGDTVTDFRGDTRVLVSANRPISEGRSGKVTIRYPSGSVREVYDRVVNLAVREVSDTDS